MKVGISTLTLAGLVLLLVAQAVFIFTMHGTRASAAAKAAMIKDNPIALTRHDALTDATLMYEVIWDIYESVFRSVEVRKKDASGKRICLVFEWTPSTNAMFKDLASGRTDALIIGGVLYYAQQWDSEPYKNESGDNVFSVICQQQVSSTVTPFDRYLAEDGLPEQFKDDNVNGEIGGSAKIVTHVFGLRTRDKEPDQG